MQPPTASRLNSITTTSPKLDDAECARRYNLICALVAVVPWSDLCPSCAEEQLERVYAVIDQWERSGYPGDARRPRAGRRR